MNKIIFLFLLVISVLSCNKEDQIKTEISSRKDTKENQVEPDSIKIFEGLYIYNLYNNTFQDCSNANELYWVIDETKSMESTYEKVFPLAYAYGTVYANVKAKLIPTLDEKIKEKFPKTLLVKELVTLEKKNSRNTCVPFDFWCLGNELEWSLQISKKENLIELNIPGENKIYYFFYEEPRTNTDVIVYSNMNTIQRYLIKVILKKEKCYDAKSDKIYDYSAQVELSNGQKLKGCAIRGSF